MNYGKQPQNYKKLKTITINFNKSLWNPEKQTIILKFNPKSPTGFDVKMVDVYNEPESTVLTLANDVLKKFKL